MISSNINIIGRLPGNHVLVAKNRNPDDPGSNKQKVIDQLKSRDREVRTHEASHGSNPELIKIGSTEFDYTIGPDGRPYASGGRVTLSTGNAGTPEEALSKAEALAKAAMAPGSPSSGDFQAMNAAVSMKLEALNQIYSDKKNIDKNSSSIRKGTNLNLYA